MLEDSIDPNPDPAPFTRVLALAARTVEARPAEAWSRCWHDREGYWSCLRTLEHWLQRCDPPAS